MGFDSAFESAFAKGMSIGSTAVLQQIKEKKEKEEKAKEIKAKADAEQIKQNNKIELEKIKQGQDIAKTSMKSLVGMKEEIRKKQFEIMKDNNLTAEEKKVQFNELNKSYASMINGTYGQLEQVRQMTGYDYIGVANNAVQDLDLDEYVDVNIGGKSATIKSKDAEIIQSNPNMYDIDKNNNVIDKTSGEVVTAHKSFDSIIADKENTMVSKGQDEYIIKDKDGNTVKEGVITNAEAVEYTDKGFNVSKIDKPKTSVTVNVNDSQETAEQAFSKATETFNKAINTLNKGEELSDKDMISLLSAQDSKTAQAMRDDDFNEKISKMENELGTIRDLKDLAVKYKERMDSGKSGGIQEQLVVGAMKYIGSGGTLGDLTNMSEDDFAKAIGVTSVTTAQQMEIIKDLSGLAYTDSQLKQLQQILGTGFGKTYEARYKSINSYINYKKASLLKDANNKLFQKKAPATAYKTIKEFSDIKPKEKVDNNAQSRIDRIKERARKIREQKGY
jgi:hypothetical protein